MIGWMKYLISQGSLLVINNDATQICVAFKFLMAELKLVNHLIHIQDW